MANEWFTGVTLVVKYLFRLSLLFVFLCGDTGEGFTVFTLQSTFNILFPSKLIIDVSQKV